MGPRDAPIKYGIPVNIETGLPLSDAQLGRLDSLTEAAEALCKIMHDAEGSSTSDGWDYRSKRMQKAAEHLEIALILARRAALEAP
jgi:hypothetical protein